MNGDGIQIKDPDWAKLLSEVGERIAGTYTILESGPDALFVLVPQALTLTRIVRLKVVREWGPLDTTFRAEVWEKGWVAYRWRTIKPEQTEPGVYVYNEEKVGATLIKLLELGRKLFDPKEA